MNKPNKIIIHHSGTDEGTFESIKQYHVETNGWRDIGYHYLITTDGKVYGGRTENAIGAHTKGENTSSIGICIVGNFDNYKPTTLQLEGLNTLTKEIWSRYGKIPLYGHNDFANTRCPGKLFPLEEIKKSLEEKHYPLELSNWAYKPHDWIIRKGVSDGSRPRQPITREEVWTMLYKLMGD